MSDIKLFQINGEVKELAAKAVNIEKELQNLIEGSMNKFFGVRFLQSEYTTTHGGRIDSLGLDEDNCPVIFEYKRASNENVINQGLFYLDWLLDHKGDFEKLVMNKLGMEYAQRVDWSVPRLICVAADFTRYDEYAVKQINRNIELVRYKLFGKDLILFEGVNYNTESHTATHTTANSSSTDKTFAERLESADEDIKNLYYSTRDYILALGDDIQEKPLKLYTAFKKIRNFASVDIVPKSKKIYIFLNFNPDEEIIVEGFTKDMRNIGHWGTGDFQITIKNQEDFEKAKPLIEKSYTIN